MVSDALVIRAHTHQLLGYDEYLTSLMRLPL
jgi:hypothetical protein